MQAFVIHCGDYCETGYSMCFRLRSAIGLKMEVIYIRIPTGKTYLESCNVATISCMPLPISFLMT